MTREEAKQLAKQKMAVAVRHMQEAMALAEEHKFTLSLYGNPMDYDMPHRMPYEHQYFPTRITMDEATEDGHPWCGISDFAIERTKHEGVWMSSSDYGDCD